MSGNWIYRFTCVWLSSHTIDFQYPLWLPIRHHNAINNMILNKFITLRPRQNGRYFADNSFKCVSSNENVSISIKIPLNFVPKGPINNIPSLVQIMAWCRSGDKPLFEPMIASLLTHICVARPQGVKIVWKYYGAGRFICNDNHCELRYRLIPSWQLDKNAPVADPYICNPCCR